MYLTELKLNQVIIHLKLKKETGPFYFMFEEYKSFYGNSTSNRKGQKSTGYVNRQTIDFTYKVSRRLCVHLFIRNKIGYWCSKEGFLLLLNNLCRELTNYTIAYIPVKFEYQISNLHCSFSLKEVKYQCFRNNPNLFQDITEYFTQEGFRFAPAGESTDTFFIIFYYWNNQDLYCPS